MVYNRTYFTFNKPGKDFTIRRRTTGITQQFLISTSIPTCTCEQVETASMCGTNSSEQPCKTYGYLVHIRPTGTQGAVFNSTTDQGLQ